MKLGPLSMMWFILRKTKRRIKIKKIKERELTNK